MNDKEFKAYGENGFVVRHSNGRDFFCQQYQPKNGEYAVDETMAECLAGKTIEKQMEYFYVTESVKLYKTAYGEITDQTLREHAVPLREYDGVVNLLLKGTCLIGATIKGYWGEGALLPEQSVCTYYASDNEGSGTNDREDRAYLIFRNDGFAQPAIG